MTETENFGNDFSTRKRAFEKYRRAQEAVKKAAEAREEAAILWHMQLEVEVIRMGHLYRMQEKGEDPEMIAALKKREKEDQRESSGLEEELRKASAVEKQALAELAEASKELEEVTVEPRVEGLKLRFEENKLQATLSTAVVVGLATVSKLLLPSEPAYAWLSWLAYAAFLVALVGSLFEMRRISRRVENVLIIGREEVFLGGFTEKLNRGLAKIRGWETPFGPLFSGIYVAIVRIDRWAFPFGLLLFVVFVTLNLGLGQVFADSAAESDAPSAETDETAPACLFAPPFC
jgi:hypothetical protein